MTPISEATNIDIVHDYGYRAVLGGNDKAAEAIKGQLKSVDVILVAWEHNNILPLALALGASEENVPAKWSDDDFDTVYSLSFTDDGQSVNGFAIGGENFKPPAMMFDDKVETMTVCSNCTRSDGCDGASEAKEFTITPGACTNAATSFPDDMDLWGEFDFMDVCDEHLLVRTFYASKDGSCAVSTDEYKLEYDTCLGPFGPATPWGTFSCE